MAATGGDAIELQADDIAQLFDTLDPYPFPEWDLNRDAEKYIVAQELPQQQPLRVIVHHPNCTASDACVPSPRGSGNQIFRITFPRHSTRSQ